MWTKNSQMFKLDLEKAEEPEIKLPTLTGSQKKQENSREKMSTSTSLTVLKPLTGGSQQPEKFFKRWEYQATSPASWEICMQLKKQQLKWNKEQQTGSKLERSTSRLYIVTLLI